MMIEIKLPQGYVATADEEDEELLKQYCWTVRKMRSGLLYAWTRPYVNGKRRAIMMHRLIMGVETSDQHVDHRDGDGLNNQRANLRLATQAQNVLNRRPYGASGYKGVSKAWRRNGYIATIQMGGKSKYLGYYADPVDAARAYDSAARELHGEFARLNFPS